MTNAERFKRAFGITATSLWAMSGQEFIEWLTMECDVPEKNVGKWIPFKQDLNPETKRYEFTSPLPKDRQHILVTVGCKGHEPVQDDYWIQDAYGYLDSGYCICDEVTAWMPMPEPYRPRGE